MEVSKIAAADTVCDRIGAFRLLLILICVLLSCRQNRSDETSLTDNKSVVTPDTIVGRKIVTDEIAGAAYRKRAIGYFVIVNADTSVFTCVFSESKAGEKVSMDMRFPRASMTYRQRMTELRTILPEAAKDFKLESLKSIYLGRLVSNGDIAVEVTHQIMHEFETEEELHDYDRVARFLKQSKLATDLNGILRAESLRVDRISVEKVFFTTKRDLYWASKIETDSASVPDRILDCMTWIGVESD